MSSTHRGIGVPGQVEYYTTLTIIACRICWAYLLVAHVPDTVIRVSASAFRFSELVPLTTREHRLAR